MQRGYVKLWRKSIDGGWLSNHKLWAFWCWCLMKATHKEFDLVVGYKQVHLMPGEFVFGLRKAAKELKISVQSIRTLLEFLKKTQNLTIKSTHLFSIITIINWDTYQSQENEINTPINTRVTHCQHTGNNKQECKELKNVKNNIEGDESPHPRKSFVKPNLTEVTDYCRERHNTVSPQVFLNHYESNGWMVGKNKMKDWKAAVRTWETRGDMTYGTKREGTTGLVTVQKEYVPEPYTIPTDDEIKRNIARANEIVKKLTG